VTAARIIDALFTFCVAVFMWITNARLARLERERR
jgi:hypothetical protein